MQREEVPNSEIVLDDHNEDLHFRGNEMAVKGRFDADAWTFDVSMLLDAIDMLEAGAKRVELDGARAVVNDLEHNTVIIEYSEDPGAVRAAHVEDVRRACEQLVHNSRGIE